MDDSLRETITALLEPRNVAVIGASRDPESVGHGVLLSLLQGCMLGNACKPFKGRIFPVNPNADEILGVKCFSSVKDVPGEVDCAVIAVPAAIVPRVARECCEKKVKALVVISAGFGEIGNRELEREVAGIAREGGARLLGPNCLGVLRPSKNYNASFAPAAPPAGDVAFVTQSGALADSEIDVALKERYSFSAIVSLGNSADLDAADFVEWLGEDAETKSIALYLEGVRDGRKLLKAIKECGKPVVFLKGGRSAEGSQAAASHTGSLAGAPKVFDAALKQAGAVNAESFEELFDAAKALAQQPRLKQNSVVVVTNGGGAGVLCVDYCKQFGVELAELKASTIERLDKGGKMHSAYSRRNPLDLVGDALPERYEAALNVLLQEDYVHGLIVVQTLQTMTNPLEDARIVVEARKRFPQKPAVCVFMGGKFTKQSVDFLRKNGVPDFNDPRKAVRVMAALAGVL